MFFKYPLICVLLLLPYVSANIPEYCTNGKLSEESHAIGHEACLSTYVQCVAQVFDREIEFDENNEECDRLCQYLKDPYMHTEGIWCGK